MTAIIRARLGLGLEPIDAVGGTRVMRKLEVEIESAAGNRPVPRHETGRFAVPLSERLGSSLNVRMFDRARRFVPRRLGISLPEASVVREGRIHRPRLFPGVAWDMPSNATGLRARVTRGQRPVRWAQIEATRPGSDTVVLRARADDRGEFLLLLAPRTVPLTELGPLELVIAVYGPSSSEVPEPNEEDPLWDLPIEPLTTAADVAGETRLQGWIELAREPFTFTPGRVDSDQTTFNL